MRASNVPPSLRAIHAAACYAPPLVNSTPATLGSVLIVRLSALGDVLFAMPAVQALLDSGRAARVTWLVEDRAAPLLALLPGLHEVLVFPRRQPSRWPAHFARLLARRDDLVLDLQGTLKTRVQLLCLRARRTVGWDASVAREGAQRAYDTTVSPQGARHRVAQSLHLMAALGVPVPHAAQRPRLALDQGARQRAAAALAGDGPVVVLHPGTSAFGELKRWAPERFAELGDTLVARHGTRLVVTGGPGERELVEAVRRALRSPALLPQPSGLMDLAALLERAQLVVASDSLPLHLANALGTPVVGLYGPKEPAVTGPYFDRARVVRSGVACSPCTLRRCGDRICMEQLEVGAVADAASELLAEGAR
jgi:lipopolysaccharide heptosyltransferase II